MEDPNPFPTEQVSRFTRQVRIEWRTRKLTKGQFRVYRAWVGTQVVRRYLSYDPHEHEQVVKDLWVDAKDYILTQGRLAQRLHLGDIRAFINLPVIADRLHDMDLEDEHFRSDDGELTVH